MTGPNRRRFLAISASALAVPAWAAPGEWHGRAMGAEVRLTVHGMPPMQAGRLWRRVRHTLEAVERAASLFAESELVRLNTSGILANPSRIFRELAALGDQVYNATGGAYDPGVQSIWSALSEGRSPGPYVGWSGVAHSTNEIRIPRGAALTFNGIAQGWAADALAALMRAEGLEDVLINSGEVFALGRASPDRPWLAGIVDGHGDMVRSLALTDRALATSSPMATRFSDGTGHILHPTRPVRHTTVSVSAPSAAIADALSTAFCLMSRDEIDAALGKFPSVRLEYLA